MKMETQRDAIVIIQGVTVKGSPRRGCWWSSESGTHVAIPDETARLLRLPLPRGTCLMCAPDSIWNGKDQTQIPADIEFAIDLRSSKTPTIFVIARNRLDKDAPCHFVGIGTYVGQVIAQGQ